MRNCQPCIYEIPFYLYKRDNKGKTMEHTKLSKECFPILQQAIESDIVDIGSVLDILMLTKRERVKKIHPYAITSPKEERGRWQTWYKDENGVRKNIKAQSEEEILDKLYPIYFPATHVDKVTFYELYQEWLEYKKTITSSPNTIRRHEQHYNKYFVLSKLHEKRIVKIEEIFLETECNRIVKEYNLTQKEWNNVKAILKGMYSYAVRKKYLSENLMDKIEIHVDLNRLFIKQEKRKHIILMNCRN